MSEMIMGVKQNSKESKRCVPRTLTYDYDACGNLTAVRADSLSPLKTYLWDEENRLIAANTSGSVSCYFYDAAGERTVKLSGETEVVHVNGKKASENNNSAKFTAYVSPYFQISNGGAYTKHIYSGSQRIASKLGNESSFGADPRRVEQAGGLKITDLQADLIEHRFTALGKKYEKPRVEAPRLDSTVDSVEKEKLTFFYHPDHLGSTNFVTDIDCNAVQFISYIPYGEVFVEERNSSFSSSYLFNAKELDNETGLYYYGARYLDPEKASWLSVDPLWEKYPGVSPYSYCVGNPVRLVDLDGREIVIGSFVGRILAEYFGVDNFEAKVMRDINEIKKINDPELNTMMETLENSDNVYYIQDATCTEKKGNRYKVSEKTVYYNADSKKGYNGKNRPPVAALAHELGHAENHEKGTSVKYIKEKAEAGDQVELDKWNRNETNSICKENIVREYYGIETRDYNYFSNE